jgi:hypothetical protein
MKSLISFLLLSLALSLSAHPLHACPACSEAIEAASPGADDLETNEFPKAMNQSIYLMVSVPYLALGVVGYLIYRGCKKNAAYLQSLRRIEPSPATGLHSPV